MVGVDGAGAARGPGDGNAQPLCKAEQVRRRTGIFHALTHQDDRALGCEQHIEGARHSVRIRPAAAGNAGIPVFRLGGFLGGSLLEDVERHVQHDRPGPSGHHRLPRLTDGEGNHVAARGLEDAFAASPHG